MKTRHSFIFILLICILTSVSASGQNSKGYYYQVKIYHFQSKAQEERMDKFLQAAYLPALHRAGLSAIGVFKPITQDPADQLVYVLIPFKKFDVYLNMENILKKDKKY